MAGAGTTTPRTVGRRIALAAPPTVGTTLLASAFWRRNKTSGGKNTPDYGVLLYLWRRQLRAGLLLIELCLGMAEAAFVIGDMDQQ